MAAGPSSLPMPRFLEAAHAYATLGEICEVLREEYGEYREPKIL